LRTGDSTAASLRSCCTSSAWGWDAAPGSELIGAFEIELRAAWSMDYALWMSILRFRLSVSGLLRSIILRQHHQVWSLIFGGFSHGSLPHDNDMPTTRQGRVRTPSRRCPTVRVSAAQPVMVQARGVVAARRSLKYQGIIRLRAFLLSAAQVWTRDLTSRKLSCATEVFKKC
jgi:hypothetical protein